MKKSNLDLMNYDEIVSRKKLHQLVKNSRSGILFVFLLIFTFYLIKPYNTLECTIWLIVTSSVFAFRLIISSWIKHRINTDYNIKTLQIFYDIGCFLGSLCLAYLALFLVDITENEKSPEYHDYIYAIYILLVCIVPGTIVISGIRIQSYLCFIGPLAIALITAGILGKVTNNDETGVFLSLVFILPLTGAILLARKHDHFYTKLFINEIKLEESNKKLEQLASIDSLTNLFNRRAYDDYLLTEWDRNKRNGTLISLMIIDIDHFKEYNDYYGHAIGDNCIKRLANIIHASLKRPADKAFRYGGDEFIVVLPETNSDGTLEVGERIRLLIEDLNIPHATSTTSECVTVSIGIACINPTHHQSEKILFDVADNQLYRSKQSGRNAVSCNTNANITD